MEEEEELEEEEDVEEDAGFSFSASSWVNGPRRIFSGEQESPGIHGQKRMKRKKKT